MTCDLFSPVTTTAVEVAVPDIVMPPLVVRGVAAELARRKKEKKDGKGKGAKFSEGDFPSKRKGAKVKG